MQLNYKSKQDHWEQFATVRARPRRMIEDDTLDLHYFPISRQPICVHPLVLARGPEATRFLLIQSAYKYMTDIALTETEVINEGVLKIANDRLAYHFPPEMRLDAVTVMVDEAYHTYVAMDFMQQIQEKTGVPPIELVPETELNNAITAIKKTLPKELNDIFQIIAVCIGENSITKDLVDFKKETQLNPTFKDVMIDHLADEARHSGYFKNVLTVFWEQLSNEEKDAMVEILPTFIREYLKADHQRRFDRNALKALNFSDTEIETIIQDTHVGRTEESFKAINPIVKNIVEFLQKSHVLDYPPAREVFKKHKLID